MTRKQIILTFSLIAILIIPLLTATQQGAEGKGIFTDLKIGQTLTAREQGGGWSLVHSDGDVLELYRVIEITPTFIRLEDSTEMRELTIPIFSIKSIEMLKPTKG